MHATMSVVYRVLPRAEWQQALATGEFRGSALDVRDGFIHFSGPEQLAATLRIHYAGHADLVLLYVRQAALPEAAWRWEPSRSGALFPHLYAALPTEAVHRVEPLTLGPDGQHQLPQLELS
jgi:uncharacterized protein (DUF952 family)